MKKPFKRTYGVNCEKKQLIVLNKGMLHSEAIRIETIENKSIWSLLKKYINSLNKNEIFTRKELLYSVYGNRVGDGLLNNSYYGTTVDQYRRYITIANCLEIVDRGKYIKLKSIPPNLSIKKLQNHVYGSTWKRWFIPIEEI